MLIAIASGFRKTVGLIRYAKTMKIGNVAVSGRLSVVTTASIFSNHLTFFDRTKGRRSFLISSAEP